MQDYNIVYLKSNTYLEQRNKVQEILLININNFFQLITEKITNKKTQLSASVKLKPP